KKDGSEEKAEMSFIDHLEELRRHLFRSVLAVAAGMIVAGIYNDFIVDRIVLGPIHHDFVTFRKICDWGHAVGLGDKMCIGKVGVTMQNVDTTGQVSLFFTSLFVSGFIMAFPFVFNEFWKFVKPALTKNELRKTRGVIFWVSFLFFTGILFGYFILMPFSMNFLATFSMSDSIQNIWTIKSYINTMMPLVLGSGLAFQMPLVIYFLAKIGIVTGSFLRKNRRYAVVAILIIAAIITPPDVISQVVVTLPLWLLYEISIVLASRVEKEKAKEEAEEWS
ncbi:MAG TPA: twin-arginine translocase subunit TatC, partial [Chitinophagaceae bacterium]|nr:twin-arginine translocase subunit TatC [Chitinophagaceae bacterium]